MSAPARSPLLRLAAALFAADATLIALHVATSGAAAFNLDAEANVPTWCSSVKLLGVAALAVLAWRAERREAASGAPPLPGSALWLVVAGLFAALSLDETASLHERIARALVAGGPASNLRTVLLGGDAAKDAFVWPLLFSPLAIAVVFFLVGFAYSRRARLRRALALGASGLACYLTAFLLEPVAVWFSPAMAAWNDAELQRYQLLSLFEESAELFGTTLLLLTAFASLRAAAPGREEIPRM